MTRQELKERIRKGGGEGWELFSRALWFRNMGEAVAVIYGAQFSDEFPEDSVVLGTINYTGMGIFGMQIDSRTVAQLKYGDAVMVGYSDNFPRPSRDALEALRQLSNLDKEEG